MSLVLLVVGLRRYSIRKEKRSVDPDGQTATFIAFGASMVSASGSSLLFIYTLSRIVLVALFFGGCLLFLVGEVTLRERVIAGKSYVFSLVITLIGLILVVLNFSLLIHIQEPFTLIYACVAVVTIGVQMIAFLTWKRKRKQPISLSSQEPLGEE